MLVLIADKIITRVLSSNGVDGTDIFAIAHPSKDDVEDFADSMKGQFFGLLTLTVICSMIILNMFNDIESITSTIADGGDVGSMARNVSGAAAKKVQAVAKEPIKLAGHTVKEAGNMIGESETGQAVKKGLHKFRTATKKFFRVRD